jgi:hypothetical protein
MKGVKRVGRSHILQRVLYIKQNFWLQFSQTREQGSLMCMTMLLGSILIHLPCPLEKNVYFGINENYLNILWYTSLYYEVEHKVYINFFIKIRISKKYHTSKLSISGYTTRDKSSQYFAIKSITAELLGRDNQWEAEGWKDRVTRIKYNQVTLHNLYI